jgi:hypothetical protein
LREHTDEKVQTKTKWKMEIRSWMGNRQKTGEWISESVATNLKRTFECFTHSVDSTKAKPVIVKSTFEELIHMHHGYRPKLDGEKKTRKAFYFRGARVWRAA